MITEYRLAKNSAAELQKPILGTAPRLQVDTNVLLSLMLLPKSKVAHVLN
jgi:hypothetical protein